MAPDTEQELLSKVNEIHNYIVGVMGQPGAAQTLNSHERRIGRLEKWSLLLLGGGSVVVFLVKLLVASH